MFNLCSESGLLSKEPMLKRSTSWPNIEYLLLALAIQEGIKLCFCLIRLEKCNKIPESENILFRTAPQKIASDSGEFLVISSGVKRKIDLHLYSHSMHEYYTPGLAASSGLIFDKENLCSKTSCPLSSVSQALKEKTKPKKWGKTLKIMDLDSVWGFSTKKLHCQKSLKTNKIIVGFLNQLSLMTLTGWRSNSD